METASAPPLRLLALSDRNPGHFNQTRGVLKALALTEPYEVTWLEVDFRAPGILRRALTRHVGLAGRSWYRALLTACYRELQLPETPPDLVLSSGGRTALLSIALAHVWGVPNLLVGELTPALQPHFTWLLQYGTRRSAPNLIELDLVPSEVYAPDLAQSARAHFGGEVPGPLWAMFIGGNSRSHRFADADWENLAEGMNRLARQHGIRWLLTTSRRTGTAIEGLLRERLDPAVLHEAVWYGSAPRPVIAPYLGASERVFCTQDSLTMLSEAVCADRPTYALLPAAFDGTSAPENDFYRYIDSLAERRLVQRVALADLGELDPDAVAFEHRARPFLDDLNALLVARVVPGLRAAHPGTSSR